VLMPTFMNQNYMRYNSDDIFLQEVIFTIPRFDHLPFLELLTRSKIARVGFRV